jgi:hypothetical protein
MGPSYHRSLSGKVDSFASLTINLALIKLATEASRVIGFPKSAVPNIAEGFG